MSLETATETLTGDASALGGTCPMPLNDYKEIVLAHGSGGKLSQRLLQSIVLPQFRNELLAPLHDGAVFALDGSRVAFSTDSYVVSPIFFPGGDIGKLAVHGTVNDLAMCGARPLHLSVGFILEEGLPMADFQRIVQSMHGAAAEAGVTFVTGDTKVVDRGKADKVFINTVGIDWADAKQHCRRADQSNSPRNLPRQLKNLDEGKPIKPPRRRNPLRVRRHRGSRSPPRKSASCTRWTFPPGSSSHKPGQGYRRCPF